MIKKTLPILMVGIMILGSLGAGITSIAENITDETTNNTNIDTKTLSINVATPTFTRQDEFTTINLQQSESYMSRSGSPMLPVISKTFSFPIGTRINNVDIDIEWQQHHLDKKVTPTPLILADVVEVDSATLEEQRINEDVYSSTELFPSEPYTIKYGVGIKDMEHVIFVNIKCFPQYSPANDEITIPTNIDINIDYTSNTPEKSEETYDLIIITHDLFEDELQPLVAHKESHGITTKLVTVDEIYNDYDGVADWEEIKMYLADHVIQWDTKFVLLAGGHIGQTHGWYVPDFRSNNWNPLDSYIPPYDETFSSDLYFADVYTIDGYGDIFMDTWDSNMNGIYAEGTDSITGTDCMDFYPDVYLGRLPLRYEWEAPVVVDKIINYENNADDSWFKTAVLAGGDGFPPERYGGIADPDAWEGEIVCDVFANLLSKRGVESTKTYCSDRGDVQVKDSIDVYTEVSKGCGWVHLTGHASPFVLGSYEPGAGICPPHLIPFYTGFNARQFDCGYKLPFMICEGCHNAQFDITGQEFIDFIYNINPDFRIYRDEFFSHDVTSWFVVQEGGGAIAAIGNTALGLGGLNYGATEFVGGWIMLRFAEAWAIDGEEYTGSIWATGIAGYIDNFDVGLDMGDRKTIEERALIGDPSIKLGGYGGSFSDTEEPEPEEYGPVSSSLPTWSIGDSWTYALDNIDIDLSLIEDRAITLKLSSGNIILKVTDITDDEYITSLTTDNIDVAFGGMFNLYVPDKDTINISTMSFDNIQIEGQIIFDKATLGINNIDLGLIIDLAKNINNLEAILEMELPTIVKTLVSRISIPLNIDLTMKFNNTLELLQFPLTNEKVWGVPANTVTVTIDGSVQSIWLRVLKFVNNFVHIVPEEFVQYLPTIDISDVLNDLGINTTYEINAEVPEEMLKTPVFEVWGSQSINVGAGTFNAAKISIMENNANIYYSESSGNIIKLVGHISDYIPLIDDINIELIE